MIFPREVIWVGDCCHVKPARNQRRPILERNYPSVIFDGECWRANRLSYHLNKEPIPLKPDNHKDGFVLHTCDNKWCVNPDHLYLGTAKQNVIDAWDRDTFDRRNKISKKMKGLAKSPETRERMRLSQIGNTKARGKPKSSEGRKNMSEAAKRRWARARGEI